MESDLFHRFAHLGTAGKVRQVHERLAAETVAAKDTAALLEIHHHAVLARDVERAKGTALFYGTELRDLATQLRLEGQREGNRAKFSKAADLFEYVVKNFDGTDACAWEYLGYNLARASGMAQRQRISFAHEKAHQLWSENPLYHGRLLEFRGQMGDDIVAAFASWLDRYVNKFGNEQDAVSFFAEAALKGLRRGKQSAQVMRILAGKRARLERFAPRALTAIVDDE